MGFELPTAAITNLKCDALPMWPSIQDMCLIGDLSSKLCAVTLSLVIPEITEVQKLKWCMKQNSFEKSPFQKCFDGHIVRQTSNEWWLLLEV